MSTALRALLALAIGVTVVALAPSRADAAPLTGATALSARSQLSCAVVAGGQVRCWGAGDDQQIGDGAGLDRSAGVTVRLAGNGAPLVNAVQVTVGRVHACARLVNKRVRCWGTNSSGQLGDGTTTTRPLAVLVRNPTGSGPLENVTQVSLAHRHTCARLTNARVRCWGGNTFGQLGDGTTTNRLLPRLVVAGNGNGPLEDVAQVVTGEQHTCARKVGQARCWGDNAEGQLGDGTTTDRLRAVKVIGVAGTPGAATLTNVATLSTADEHTCARLTDGQARCWGSDHHGERADGYGVNDENRPTVVKILVDGDYAVLTGITQVSAGGSHTCFRIGAGQVLCAGANTSGQLGIGDDTDDVWSPVVVHNPTGSGPLLGVAQVATGGTHTCARLTNAQVWCWGANLSGQVGDGSVVDRPLPRQVQGA
jgi:alpha-tubulin suppressor-like RCC1 family protein